MMPAGEHRNGTGIKAGTVRCGVDTAGEPGYHDKIRIAEIGGDHLGKFHAGRRCVAGAHNRDQRPLERVEVSAHRDEWRRVVNHLQP